MRERSGLFFADLSSLPSHEGSGLKCVFAGVLQPHRRLPSYEGSGLK